MREGWSVKDGAQVIGVHPARFEQAVGPAFLKIAMLMLANARRTMADLQVAMEKVEAGGIHTSRVTSRPAKAS